MIQATKSFLKNNLYTKPVGAADNFARNNYQSAAAGVEKKLGSAKQSFKGAKATFDTLSKSEGAIGAAKHMGSAVYSGMNKMTMGGTAAGVAAGGAYGAMSDNTSIAGGMAMGGLAGFGAVKGAQAIHGRYGSK